MYSALFLTEYRVHWPSSTSTNRVPGVPSTSTSTQKMVLELYSSTSTVLEYSNTGYSKPYFKQHCVKALTGGWGGKRQCRMVLFISGNTSGEDGTTSNAVLLRYSSSTPIWLILCRLVLNTCHKHSKLNCQAPSALPLLNVLVSGQVQNTFKCLHFWIIYFMWLKHLEGEVKPH